MNNYRVAFATGSRADYGIVRNYIAKLNADTEVDFCVLTTGALLISQFGSAVNVIEQLLTAYAHQEQNTNVQKDVIFREAWHLCHLL